MSQVYASLCDRKWILCNCRTGRFEAHIWQEGKQIYLGGFDAEEQAALAYDLAALKFRGLDAQTNYDKSTYEQEMLQCNEVHTLGTGRTWGSGWHSNYYAQSS